MEITRELSVSEATLLIKGRIDAYWSEALARACEEVLRGGLNRIALDLAGVDFLSSAGIRILLKYAKELRRLGGGLRVVHPSAAVQSVLAMAGFESLIGGLLPAGADTGGARLDNGPLRGEIFTLDAGARLTASLIGDPGRLAAGAYTAEDCRRRRFPRGTCGLGLGALGEGFAACRERFGEFLALEGAVAQLPADEALTPDYMVAQGQLVPEVEVLYGLELDGAFSHLLRFAAVPPESPAAGEEFKAAGIPFSRLAQSVLETTGTPLAGFVLAAEIDGLVGASLRCAPTREFAGGLFAHPAIRERLTFTAERAFSRAFALVLAVVTRESPAALAPFLRPLGPDGRLHGHAHAAIFAYRPLRPGRIDLHETAALFFAEQPLRGLLHLLDDRRVVTGAGESEFLRGACWCAPVAVAAAKP